MQQFFLKLFKNKKTLLFVFLFLFVVAFAFPQVAFADWYNPLTWLGTAMEGFFNALVAFVLFIPLFLTAVAADISGSLLGFAISLITNGTSYTDNIAAQIGWPIVRDFSNMIIVLGFVVIGIATALRIKEYEAKQLLAKLIVAALLVNFSLLICGVFIDATNIATKYFFSQATGGLFGKNIADSFAILKTTFKDDWTVFGPSLVAMMIFNFFAFFIYLLYALLLLGRVIALWILVILAPLAFVCRVFPITKKVWGDWSKNFLQWSIIGIPGGLFYYIGAKMIEKMPTLKALEPTLDLRGGFIPGISQMVTNSFSLLLPGLFLVIGFLASLQFSAMGAGAITGFAKKHGSKIAAGGFAALNKAHSKSTGAALGWAGGKISGWGESLKGRGDRIGKIGGSTAKVFGGGLSRMKDFRASAQQTKTDIMKGLEFTGAVAPGTAGAMEAKALKENQSRMSALISQGRLAEVNNIAEGRGVGSNPAERAAAIGALLKSKNFDMDNGKHVEGLTHFGNYGGDIGEFTDKEPDLAGYDSNTIKNTFAKENTEAKVRARGGSKITMAEAKNMVIRDAHAKKLVNTKIEDVSVETIASAPAGALPKANDKFSIKKINVYKEFVDPSTDSYRAVNDEMTKLKAKLAAGGMTSEESAKINKRLDNITDNIAEISSW